MKEILKSATKTVQAQAKTFILAQKKILQIYNKKIGLKRKILE